jgi:hypothetical protein
MVDMPIPNDAEDPIKRGARFKSRQWLEDPAGVQIPDSDSLQVDACGPTYRYDALTRLSLESKEDMRRRIGEARSCARAGPAYGAHDQDTGERL